MGMIKRHLAVLLTLGLTGACSARESELSPQQCWADFRQAVMAGDYQKLQSMTQFPLALHGAVDSIPVREVDRDQFEATLNKILAQPMASYEGDKLVTYTMRELVEKTTAVDKGINDENKQFRVGELVFEYRGNTCKFVRAYLSD